MIIKTALKALVFTFTISSISNAATNDWFRDAAISPDGKTVLFSHKGDIYSG